MAPSSQFSQTHLNHWLFAHAPTLLQSANQSIRHLACPLTPLLCMPNKARGFSLSVSEGAWVFWWSSLARNKGLFPFFLSSLSRTKQLQKQESKCFKSMEQVRVAEICICEYKSSHLGLSPCGAPSQVHRGHGDEGHAWESARMWLRCGAQDGSCRRDWGSV